MTGLADCNNFFVSCERTVHPELEGRAVVVLSNNDGCAIARSNEAKRLGIKMGQPAFELRDMIRSGQLTAISGHHVLYHDISVRVHEIFRRYVPRTLDYSVDEAFLDMSGIPPGVIPSIASAIVDACRRETGIPVTVGVAPTKTLSKIATEHGKKTWQSVCCFTTAEEMLPITADMPIQDLWGVGRRLAKRLYMDGIRTIHAYAEAPLTYIRRTLGVNGERTWHELHGRPCIELSHLAMPLQSSISQTRTFPKDISDFDYLRSRIVIYTAECSRRLRAMRGVCRVLTVFLRGNRFHKESSCHAPQIDLRLYRPTSDAHTLADVAVQGLVKIFDRRAAYKRGGVVLSEITPAEVFQPSLFDSEETPTLDCEERRLMSAIDHINSAGLNPAVRLASQITSGVPYHNDGYSSSFGFCE